MKTFSDKVLGITKNIKKGQALTYSEVARLAGSPRACRAVGNILHKNRSQEIPCHRVIKSNGQIGGYNKGTNQKVKILKNEGLKIDKLNNCLEIKNYPPAGRQGN